MDPKINKIVTTHFLKNHLEINWLSDRFFFEIGLILDSFSVAWNLQNLVKLIGCIRKYGKSHDVTSEGDKISFRIDLGVILAPSWGPKSNQNRLKMCWKNDEKMMMTRMAKKSHTGDYGWARPDDFGARGGGRRRGKPLLQSWRMELERIERVGGMEDETKTLNHLSP